MGRHWENTYRGRKSRKNILLFAAQLLRKPLRILRFSGARSGTIPHKTKKRHFFFIPRLEKGAEKGEPRPDLNLFRDSKGSAFFWHLFSLLWIQHYSMNSFLCGIPLSFVRDDITHLARTGGHGVAGPGPGGQRRQAFKQLYQ